MKGVMLGRGDLVRALGSGGPEVQEALAWLLGLEREVPSNEPPQLPPTERVESQDTVTAGVVPSPPAADAVQVPFWIAGSFLFRNEHVRPKVSGPRSRDHDQRGRTDGLYRGPVPFAPLASHAAVQTLLRRQSAFADLGGDIDLEQIVSLISRGELLLQLPHRRRRR